MKEVLTIFSEAKERIAPTKDSRLENLLIQVETEIRKAIETGTIIGVLLFIAVMAGGGIFTTLPWLLPAMIIAGILGVIHGLLANSSGTKKK